MLRSLVTSKTTVTHNYEHCLAYSTLFDLSIHSFRGPQELHGLEKNAMLNLQSNRAFRTVLAVDCAKSMCPRLPVLCSNLGAAAATPDTTRHGVLPPRHGLSSHVLGAAAETLAQFRLPKATVNSCGRIVGFLTGHFLQQIRRKTLQGNLEIM